MDKIKFNGNVASKKQITNLNKKLSEDGNRLFLEFFTLSAYTNKGLKIKIKLKISSKIVLNIMI